MNERIYDIEAPEFETFEGSEGESEGEDDGQGDSDNDESDKDEDD